MPDSLNLDVARRLEEVAALLSEQGANPFRVEAYRRAAATVRRLGEPIGALLEREGPAGLEALPGIGESIARSIRDLLRTGRLPMLERLRGSVDAVALLESIPGIGPVLAERLHHDLGIDTLEELETAAHDGRLSELAGVGPKRLAGIIDSLRARLERVRPPGPAERAAQPAVGEILDVDREYREGAEAKSLRRIAPKRFNPAGEAWLPILHTVRGPRHYTALFSNTARAHRLGRTHDWVVLFIDGGAGGDHQCTVVTSTRGPLRGRRVVRGREEECEQLYRGHPAPA